MILRVTAPPGKEGLDRVPNFDLLSTGGLHTVEGDQADEASGV